MLIYENKDLKMYVTNNLLLVLKGDNIVKDVYFEDPSMVEDLILEVKESLYTKKVIRG
ncbi:MAG: hypothetical protein M0Q88_02730 [Bacilli bacterium]|nr:hypothetical protein [Bacilli bacterium]